MATKDPRVDAYIAKAPPFAKPILTQLRNVIHKAIPGVEETIKWWKASLIVDKKDASAGTFGRITSVKDLPPEKVLVGYLKEAQRLNEEGITVAKKPKPAKTAEPPDYFMAALKKNKKALKTFEEFSPSQKRDYVEWIVEAKRDETRAERLETAVEWMAEGKPRMWKYMK